MFGGGGGTILPHEVEELHFYGITRIYSPDDGRELGLQGMINDLLEKSDFAIPKESKGHLDRIHQRHDRDIGRLISLAETFPEDSSGWIANLGEKIADSSIPVLGITGTGGAGNRAWLTS